MMSDPRIVGYLPPSGSSERTKILRLKVSHFHFFFLSHFHFYSFTRSCFHAQVISADNLAKKDIFGASDPYVRIDLVTVRGDEVCLID